MCGISGIYSFNNAFISKEQLKHFSKPLAHRGPDGEAYEILDNGLLGLGHRRLATLDLSEAGRQPMSYADGRFWIVYNGEVFNFLEIRTELEQKGYVFQSQTDTEVVLASYMEWGKDCLEKFNGMWAFAIWDKQEEELFLARDRFGIKPLYYLHQEKRRFAFASETTSFKYLEGYAREFDNELLEYNIQDPYSLEGLGYTPFKNILQLLPAHYIIVKKGAEIQQKRWWHIEENLHKEIPQTIEKQAEKFYEIFRDACKIRLISDVPVATALSGGLDSTSVYSTVFDILKNEHQSRTNTNSQQAFSAIFPGLPQDEKEYADKAVQFVDGKINYTENSELNLAETIIEETKKADFISSSPITSISAVYKGMRNKGIIVSMDGHGVDEMLFGYRDMVYALYNYELWNGTVENTEKYAKVLQNMYHPDVQLEQKKKFAKELEDKLKRESSFIFKLKKLIKRNRHDNSFLPIDLPSLSDKPYNFSSKPLPERMLYYEFFQHTLPALLRNFDRASMMNSIEIRMPFMDWRLVCYVFSLPVSSKIGNGFTKLLLRKAMKDKIDEELRTRTFKVGIGSPVEYWFNGQLKEWVLDTLKDGELKQKIEVEYDTGKVKPDLVREAWLRMNVDVIET